MFLLFVGSAFQPGDGEEHGKSHGAAHKSRGAVGKIRDQNGGGAAELVGLDELLARADVITLHALLTDETREMIGVQELARMKTGAYLVNCARAALVDHAALGEALRSGHLGGCALDVLPTEPPGPDEPAFGWPRTIITPHSAWYSPESATAPYRMAAEAVAAVLEGREPYAALARPAA